MKALGIFFAVALHVGILLFGGVFFLNDKEKAARKEELVEIETLEEDDKKPEEEEKPEDKPEERNDEVPEETPQFTEAMPDQPPGPALAPMSLADMEAAMSGLSGEGGFGGSGGAFTSGGVIGGAGGLGGGGGTLSASQLDQKPRILVKVDPKPPKQLTKNLPQVTVTAFIDASGNVMRAEVAPAVDASVQKAIMDAVLRWKYEPGQRGGQKVGCKVSHKLSFQ